MGYSLNSFKGLCRGLYRGGIIGAIKRDTWRVDCSSCSSEGLLS